VNLDDLDAANTSMFNLVANSKGRVAARAEKKLTLQRQHQIQGEKTIQEEHDLERKWQAERQRLDAGRPKELLGASKKKTDFSQFEFEDDDGQQREYNEQYETIVDGLYEQAKGLRQNAEFQGFILNQQIKQIERITDNVRMVPLISYGEVLTRYSGASQRRQDWEECHSSQLQVRNQVKLECGVPSIAAFNFSAIVRIGFSEQLLFCHIRRLAPIKYHNPRATEFLA